MTRYRLLACDIDDTLVRFPGLPSTRVTAAIRAAVDLGVTVTLVTGRAFRRARPVAEALDLNTPIICNHGGSIRDPVDGAIIHRSVLSPALAIRVVRWLQNQQVHILVFDGDVVYHNATGDRIVPDFQVYTRGQQSIYAPDLLRVLPQQIEIILCTSQDRAHLERMYQAAQTRYGSEARVLFSHPFGVDIMPSDGHKSAALSWLAESLNIPRAQVMAVGDGGNDVDMLSWAGLGVAMGNGTPEARAAANIVAPPFEKDGLAWAIERYVL